MLIDGWDIAEANARQARYIDGHHELKNDSSWNEGSNRPIFQRSSMKFKTFTIDLWVKGKDYQDIVDNCGRILARLIAPAIIEPERTTHKFKAILNKYNVAETSKDRFHVLSLEFSGYEYLDAEKFTIEVNTSFTITNTGTAETPVTLEITPLGGAVDIPDDQMEVSVLCDEDGAYFIDDDDAAIGSYDYDNLTIRGLCRDVRTGDDLDIVIRNITPEKKIIIDGETGLITEDGKAKIEDVDIWALPTLQPGVNVIRTNNNWLRIVVNCKPRFM